MRREKRNLSPEHPTLPSPQPVLIEVGRVQYILMAHPATSSEEGVEPADPLAGLSAAEREVALFSSEGLSNDEIAFRRGTSARTVANQIASIFRKMNVTSRTALAVRMSSAPSTGQRVQKNKTRDENE